MTFRLGIALASALTVSCGGLGSFDVDLPADGVIPGLSQKLTNPQFGSYGDVGGTVSQTFTNKGVKSGGFKSAKITAGSISVPAGMGSQMAYIESFEIDASAPGLDTVAVAKAPASAFSAKTATVQFELPGVELKPYLVAASVTFNARPVFTSPPPFSPTALHIDLTMHVQVF